MGKALPNLQRMCSIQLTYVRSTNNHQILPTITVFLYCGFPVPYIISFVCLGRENGLTSNDFKVAALILKMSHLNFGACLWF